MNSMSMGGTFRNFDTGHTQPACEDDDISQEKQLNEKEREGHVPTRAIPKPSERNVEQKRCVSFEKHVPTRAFPSRWNSKTS